MKTSNPKTKRIYLGIECLRMILSFLIVSVHYGFLEKNKLFYFAKRGLNFYVPTFFLISFYFSYNTFTLKNINKIKMRFKRILIPYIIWPQIIWIKNNLINYEKNLLKPDLNIFKKLYYQIIIGAGVHGVFWFHFNLIFISVFLIINIFMFSRYYPLILSIVSILIYFINTSNFILNYFKSSSPLVNHSIKPIGNSLIYSITGFYLGSINLIKKLSFYRNKCVLLFLILFYILNVYKNFILFKYNKYFYSIKTDLIAINLFIIFGLLPIDKINNLKIIFFIKQITSYTGGIYYIHPEIIIIH